MSEDKSAQRTNVSIEFGILVSPLRELSEQTVPPPLNKYRFAKGQVLAGFSDWMKHVREICTIGEIVLDHEIIEFKVSVRRLTDNVQSLIQADTSPQASQNALRILLHKAKEDFCKAMGNLEFELPAKLSAANTPFTVHLRIADVIRTAQNRIHYFDRYLRPDFFPLYLRTINRNIQVRLVTTRGGKNFGVQSVQSVAELAEKEFADFQLFEVTKDDLHGRHLRVDNQNFSIGSSAKDAGKQPTNFDPSDSTDEAHKILDDIIASGIQILWP